MSSSTLYRKYRPRSFSEVIGQTHIIRTITNALLHGRVNHAYLFTGSRGTGKTTLARLLAKALNCSDRTGAEPCLKCPHCLAMAEGRSLDIIEIDAASNTGVDNIRELRETVRLRPTLGTHKVYIIDEVHMLSQGAWNALLKTLEEPPKHVVFILATTELHKIPETILSRCQRFDFARLPIEQIIEKLSRIAETEQVKADLDALEMIALSAEGGMRDAESLLTQVIALEDKHITGEEVGAILGITSQGATETFAGALARRDFPSALDTLREITENGFDSFAFATRLLHYFRKVLLVSVDPTLIDQFRNELTEKQRETLATIATALSPTDAVRLVELFQSARKDIRLSPIPELPLEVATVKFIHPKTALAQTSDTPKHHTPNLRDTHQASVTPETSTVPKPATFSAPPPPTKSPVPSASVADTSTEQILEKNPGDNPVQETGPKPTIPLETIRSSWNRIVDAAKNRAPSLGLALTGVRPITSEGDIVTLSATFSLHKDKLSQEKNRLTLEDAFDTILKIRPKIRIVLEERNPGLRDANDSTVDVPIILAQTLEALGGRIVN